MPRTISLVLLLASCLLALPAASQTVTSAMLGSFRENVQTREEFLSLISDK